MACRRQMSSTLAPASCSFSTPITCSALKLLCFMGHPPRRSKGGRFRLALARIVDFRGQPPDLVPIAADTDLLWHRPIASRHFRNELISEGIEYLAVSEHVRGSRQTAECAAIDVPRAEVAICPTAPVTLSVPREICRGAIL